MNFWHLLTGLESVLHNITLLCYDWSTIFCRSVVSSRIPVVISRICSILLLFSYRLVRKAMIKRSRQETSLKHYEKWKGYGNSTRLDVEKHACMFVIYKMYYLL